MGEGAGEPEWSKEDLERWPGLKNWGKSSTPRIDWAQRFLENINRAAKSGDSDDPTWSDDGD